MNRGFSATGDVETAFEAVARSGGLERTRDLAQRHSQESTFRRHFDSHFITVESAYIVHGYKVF